MLVTLNEVLPDAQRNHYAVGLFNTVNMEMARGVIAAAEEARSPVIIGTAEVLLPFSDLKELAPLLSSMAKEATVPVVLHFDHGLSKDWINRAIKMGFSSIMYDCSTKSFEENLRDAQTMANYAHSNGISIEAELGHVGANDGSAEGSGEGDHSVLTDPTEARVFVESTGVDALAIAIGTAHGAYKSKPKLDFERLKEIRRTIDTPLVLHGGSGLSDDDFRTAIANGITKINIFTDINNISAKAAHDLYREGAGMTDVMLGVTEAVKRATLAKMNLFGSAGRV
ncbi:MAG: class II fructose-bisphosphate aldolase [Clostridiales bacterium]|jgi:fructose-bisphosphate aldolase class II|nr:class II fructose-bisphosphate aldolase [Clostridiales bacterium]